jgi:hypothetical protein
MPARFTILASAAAFALACADAPPAAAHHSFAMFDNTKIVTIKGTIKEFDWTNPHVTIFVLAGPDDHGGSTLWSVELTSPGNLKRLGWTRSSLSPGDKVEIDLHPLRNGTHGGSFEKAKLVATGQVLTSDFSALSR